MRDVDVQVKVQEAQLVSWWWLSIIKSLARLSAVIFVKGSNTNTGIATDRSTSSSITLTVCTYTHDGVSSVRLTMLLPPRLLVMHNQTSAVSALSHSSRCTSQIRL